MARIKGLKPNVTPNSTTKEGLQAQIDEQVDVLYSQEATIKEKEIAALNFNRLVGYYATLFNEVPTGAEHYKI